MNVTRESVTATTDASGDATVYIGPINGLLDRIRYVKTDFADGVDFTITLEDTGETLWQEDDVNDSAVRAVRQPTYTTAGAAALYGSPGVAVLDRIAVAGRIQIVVANGGNTASGLFVAEVI